MRILFVNGTPDNQDVPGILGINIIKSVENSSRKSLVPRILRVLKKKSLYRIGFQQEEWQSRMKGFATRAGR